MDDLTLGGDFSSIVADVDKVIVRGRDLGLSLNPDKCELISSSSFKGRDSTIDSFQHIAPAQSLPSPGSSSAEG